MVINQSIPQVYSPTRATLLSGRHVIHTGVYDPMNGGSKDLPLQFTLWPAFMKDLGYSTHAARWARDETGVWGMQPRTLLVRVRKVCSMGTRDSQASPITLDTVLCAHDKYAHAYGECSNVSRKHVLNQTF